MMMMMMMSVLSVSQQPTLFDKISFEQAGRQTACLLACLDDSMAQWLTAAAADRPVDRRHSLSTVLAARARYFGFGALKVLSIVETYLETIVEYRHRCAEKLSAMLDNNF